MEHTYKTRNFHALPILLLAVLAFARVNAQSQSDAVMTLDIEPQKASSALLKLARSSNTQILLNGDASQVEVEGLKGEYRLEEALAALLTGTGLEYEFATEDLVLIHEVEQAAEPEDDDEAQANDDDEPIELPEQVVTGSRLARNAWQIPAQVITLSREELENSGASTLERALRQLPQNINGTTEFLGARLYEDPDATGRLLGTSNINGSSTINLRGLGESATLVLINGKRAGDSGLLGGFTDISDVPVSMIERVEIQMDGASAVYGSDAIGGVVNVILRKDYDTVQVRLRRDGTTGGGNTQDNVAVNAGASWGSGNVMFNLDAYQASSGDGGQDDLNFDAVSQHGYPGNVRGSGRGYPGRPTSEIAPGLTKAAIDSGLLAMGETVTIVPIPSGQDGTSLTINDFLGSINTFRTNEAINLLQEVASYPNSDRYQFRVAVHQEVNDWLEVAAGLAYRTRRTGNPSGTALDDVTFDVAAENPYNPFGRDVEVDIDLGGVLDLGTRRYNGSRESVSLDLDLSGAVGARLDWEIRSRLVDRESTAQSFNLVSFTAFNRLVDNTRVHPSDALNVFGNSFTTDGNNANVLADADFHLPVKRSDSTNKLASSELVIRTELFSLPAGKVRGVIGGEWRKASVKTEYGNTFSKVITATAPLPSGAITEGFAQRGTRTLRAGFAEVFIPVVGADNALPFCCIHDFNISFGARHESSDGYSYEETGTETHYQSEVWSAGLVMRPIEAVKLWARKSTGFRAPDLAHSLFAPVVNDAYTIFDYRRRIDPDTGALTFLFFPPFYSITQISGGNPILLPEESTNLAFGIEITPPFLSGLSFSVSHHDTEYVNRITQLNVIGFIVVNRILELYPTQYTLDEDGRILSYDARTANVGRVDTRGFDYGLDYEFEIGGNTFELYLNWVVTNEMLYDNNVGDSEEPLEHVDLIVEERRYRGGISWRRGGWYLRLNARTASNLGYEAFRTLGLNPDDPVLEPVQVTVRKHTPVNFRATFDIGEIWSAAPNAMQNLRLALGVNNIFRTRDREMTDPAPRFANARNIPTGLNEARGRAYYLEITKEF